MIKLVQYPQADCSEGLRKQIILLQCIAWPPTTESRIEDICWPADLDNYLTSFALVDDNIAVSHVAVLGKDITHKGQAYRTLGLSQVVTHPSYRRKGFGLQIIKQAVSFIENSNPDISIFTCLPSLISFYSQGGWEYRADICLVGGTHENPFQSDSLGLATMIRFFSDKAKKHGQDFDNSDICLELKEGKLW